MQSNYRNSRTWLSLVSIGATFWTASNLALAEVTSGTAPAQTPNAASGDGAGGSGGGYAYGNKLLDYYEAEQLGESYLDPVKLPEYADFVRPILKRVRDLNSRFYNELISILTEKAWIEVATQLDPSHESQTHLSVDQVARQTQLQIQIFKPWFENPNVSETDRGGLFLHELVRGVALKKKVSQENVRELTRLLSLDTALNAKVLSAYLVELRFETKEQVDQAEDLLPLPGDEKSESGGEKQDDDPSKDLYPKDREFSATRSPKTGFHIFSSSPENQARDAAEDACKSYLGGFPVEQLKTNWYGGMYTGRIYGVYTCTHAQCHKSSSDGSVTCTCRAAAEEVPGHLDNLP